MFKNGDKVVVRATYKVSESILTALENAYGYLVVDCVRPGYVGIKGVHQWYDVYVFDYYDPGDGFGFPDTQPKDPAPATDEHAKRKAAPLATGCYDYFPDALLAIAALSLAASKQHGHGKMHWEFDKSNDHKDCIARHLQDANEIDSDGHYHGTKAAWRALALEQTRIEAADPALHAKRQAQRDRAKRS